MEIDAARPARRDDVPHLAALRARRRGTPAEAQTWAERAALRTGAGDPAYRLLVAERNGECVGYGVATRFRPPPEAPANAAPAGPYLAGLMVHPAFRRRGVGAALVRARLDWFALQGEPVAFYFADDDNAATVALHHRFGFEPVTRDFWFPGLAHPEAPMTLYRVRLATAQSTPERSGMP